MRRWFEANHDLHGYANSSGAERTCLLTELTEEAVAKHVLEFFEKLASEPSDAGNLPTTRRARRTEPRVVRPAELERTVDGA